MTADRLDALLQRFSVQAQMFHSGPLCGVTVFPAGDQGQLHLIRSGGVEAHHGGRRRDLIDEPSLVFYPRPLRHRFVTDARRGADMACANVAFNAGAINPLAQALPAVVVMPLREIADAAAILDVLFREAFSQQCGRRHVVNRLFEVVLILILRTLINGANVDQGLLAGMAHPRLAKALIAMHEAPARSWSLQRLAARAGMSRSHFAAVFHELLGVTPGEYLARHRICLAQDLLRRGESLKITASQVGYGSTSALSRAFTALCGESPRQWKANHAAAA